MSEWTLMELEGLLVKEAYGNSFTFATVIPEDRAKGTPAMKVGLGWFTQKNGGLTKASLNPNASPSSMGFANSIISDITELYVQLIKDHPSDWATQILIRKGYATVPSDRDLIKAKTFENIPVDVIKNLAMSYSLQEVMFLIVAGVEDFAADWLPVLKGIKEDDPSFQYEDALKYIELGIPADELTASIHLPFDMVEELYS